MAFYGTPAVLELPPELAGVSPTVLKEFLSGFSRLLVSQLAPEIPEQRVQVAVTELLGSVGANTPKPVDVRLEFKHVCKFIGCSLEDCQLCRNNPSKVCDDADCFDHQYWVRDDGKGGQLIKAKCGSDVCLQLVDKASNTPVVLPDVRLKLYVVNGQQLAGSGPGDAPAGLYLSDDGHPLFAAAGVLPEDDKGVLIEVTQDDQLGPAGHIPELQFLDKNSKFKVGGRTFKSFKLLARAVRYDAASRQQVTLAQVESESFKVTTKKGYDGCRKADFLYAHEPITDKTFANLGETTISNLKANFDGVETVEDLMSLVQACRSAPDLEARLRETLNMARDAEKWRNLMRMLTEKVVWDDSLARMFVLPTAARPLGLLYRANRAQVDFANPTGIIVSLPTAAGQLRVARLTDRLQVAAARHVEALRGLAAGYWRYMRHPGWTLAPDALVWEEASAANIIEAFTEALGQGDPTAVADMHLAALQQAQLAAISSAAGTSLLRAPTPLGSGSITPPPLLAGNAGLGVSLQGSLPSGLADLAGNPLGSMGFPASGSGAAWGAGGSAAAAAAMGMLGEADPAVAAAAMAAAGSAGPMSVSGTTASPVMGGGLPRGVSGGYDSNAESALAGFVRIGQQQQQQQQQAAAIHHTLSMPSAAAARANSGRPPITTSTQLGAALSAPGPMTGQGLLLPNQLPHQQVFGGGQVGASPFAINLPGVSMPPPPQQQQQMLGLGAAAQSGGKASRPSSSSSGFSGQQQQQQLSSNTLLLQQAIQEGWPAPQVKAVLDQMSDEELRQLVAQQPDTAAGVLARAGGEELAGFGAMDGVAMQQQQQQLGMQQQQQHMMMLQQPQQQQPPMRNMGFPRADSALRQQQQQACADQPFRMNMTVGPGTPVTKQEPDDHHNQQQQGPTAASAAAALAALFADSETLATAGGPGRSSFDVSLTADQMTAAGLLNLSADSFADPTQWGDILENLRQLSSGSGGQPPVPGAAAAAAAVAGAGPAPLNNSFSTEWIPELLFRLESESKEKEKNAAAAAAAEGAVAAAAEAGPTAAAAAAAGPAPAPAGDEEGDEAAAGDRAAGRKAKRERSKTGQAPSQEQLAQLQALFAADPGQLRSLSKGESHFGSFNRHFPVARCSSKNQEVHQGAQVANPWNPGQAAGASGVPTSPPGAAAGIASNPAATTEAGAAAVATVTGFAHLPAVQEAADGAGNASNELLNMLGMSAAEAGQCGGGSAGGGENMYLSSSMAEPRAAGMHTPFMAQCSADTAAATVHAPTTQRDSSGKAGWISSLFRSGSSWSSKSNSLHGSSSGALQTVNSHSSKDASKGGNGCS
uniref:Uncharacterized protein n=1 Tax=Tetradesmus obliquus TaxID=3088 RepID=A0A383V5P7_TETOB